jgi:hypothetical protein
MFLNDIDFQNKSMDNEDWIRQFLEENHIEDESVKDTAWIPSSRTERFGLNEASTYPDTYIGAHHPFFEDQDIPWALSEKSVLNDDRLQGPTNAHVYGPPNEHMNLPLQKPLKELQSEGQDSQGDSSHLSSNGLLHLPDRGGDSNFRWVSTDLSVSSESVPASLPCPQCEATFQGEYRKGNLLRHKRREHGHPGPLSFPCKEPRCGKIYKRPDALRKHERDRHRKPTELRDRSSEPRAGQSSRLPDADASAVSTSRSNTAEDSQTGQVESPTYYTPGYQELFFEQGTNNNHEKRLEALGLSVANFAASVDMLFKTKTTTPDREQNSSRQEGQIEDQYWSQQESIEHDVLAGIEDVEINQRSLVTDAITSTAQRLHQLPRLSPDDLIGYFDADDDSDSVISSYAASVGSIMTTASSATDYSRASSFSQQRIKSAISELIKIFDRDEVLRPLYTTAVHNPNIGLDRLQRNLRRFIKAYGKQLGKEADDALELLASRFVFSHARRVAQSVTARFGPVPACQVPRTVTLQEESSDDDAEERPVDEDAFSDLVTLREFLIGSTAFQALRNNLQAFVLPKALQQPILKVPDETLKEKTMPGSKAPAQQVSKKRSPKKLSWRIWCNDMRDAVVDSILEPETFFCSKAFALLAIDAVYLATDALFVATGQLEPSLASDASRLRWKCVTLSPPQTYHSTNDIQQCGDSLFSDVKEYRESGISELVAYMERSTGGKVLSAPYRTHSGNQQYIAPRPLRWLRNGFRKLSVALAGLTRASSGLPQHNNQSSVAGACTSNNTSATTSSLHLMACMHQNRTRKILQQDRLGNISTDRDLLCFLRRQYVRHRGRILNMFSFKSVQGIFFVKFNLPMGNTVIVRDHDPYCVADSTRSSCQCIPPESKVEPSPDAEYRCIPGPPATYPPVPSEHLLMLFTCPSYAHEDDDWILRQLPKRICGELQGKAGQPAEGWGIYYKEGWDRDMITLVVFVVFLVASLVFGILWSVFKFDVQGAFGVAAYMVGVCAILVPLIAMRAEKMR